MEGKCCFYCKKQSYDGPICFEHYLQEIEGYTKFRYIFYTEKDDPDFKWKDDTIFQFITMITYLFTKFTSDYQEHPLYELMMNFNLSKLILPNVVREKIRLSRYKEIFFKITVFCIYSTGFKMNEKINLPNKEKSIIYNFLKKNNVDDYRFISWVISIIDDNNLYYRTYGDIKDFKHLEKLIKPT